jgi:hypothetical protein
MPIDSHLPQADPFSLVPTFNVTAINVNLGKDMTTGVVDTRGKFAAGVNEIGGQFSPGPIDTSGGL